jgi:hypothetical protein
VLVVKYLLVFVIAVHGLINLLGFVKAFGLAELPALTQGISRPVGLLWLLSAVLFLAAAYLLAVGSLQWWIAALPAVVISQVLVFGSWGDAKAGTVANLIVLLAMVPSIADALPTGLGSQYRQAAREGLSRSRDASLLTEQDLVGLPSPVQRYIRFSGAVGKPKVQNFHAVMGGGMRRTQGGDVTPSTAEQYNFFDQPSRFYLQTMVVNGVPASGYHAFSGDSATMRVRVASVAQVVDAKGEKMNQSETVTIFNDMCVFAPAALIDENISWEPIDDRTAKAHFTRNGITITATLIFNEKDQLVDFSSEDRFMSADGKTYANYRWSTPLRDYRDFGGRKVATKGEAVWQTPEGAYPYFIFDLKDVAYNVVR